MNIDGYAIVSDLEETIKNAGGTVTWSGEKPDDLRLHNLGIDDDHAANELPPDWFGDEDGEWLEPDARDIGDFVEAVRSGEVTLALALADRMFSESASVEAVDRAMRQSVPA